MLKIRKPLTIPLIVASFLTYGHSADTCSPWVLISIDTISAVIPACEEGDVPVLDSALQQAYLDAINEARSKEQDCGEYGVKPAVPPLVWNDALYQAAYRHSYDLAKSNTFSHTGSGTATDVVAQALHPGVGSVLDERVEYAGYVNWRAIGENLAAGTVMDVAQEAVDGWLSSPGHCVNLMSPDFTEVGMAHYEDAYSYYTHYWTQDFGKR